MSAAIQDVLREQLSRPKTGWSIGIFGALAEFRRAAHEPAECTAFAVSTAVGAIRREPRQECRPVPYEPRSAKQHDRKFGVALCLPEAAARLERRSVLTELGEDAQAIHEKDRRALLFDLGLDSPYAAFCIRTAD